MMNTILKGRLERWNDNKGFGFIRPETGKGDVFMHISALKNSARRPIAGDVIHYQLEVGKDGKTKAVNARIEGVAALKTKKTPKNKLKGKPNHLFNVLVSIALVVIAGFFLFGKFAPYYSGEPNASIEVGVGGESRHDLILQDAFQRRISNVQVEGRGSVSKLLPDDSDGSRHQKIIVRLNSGQTLLIAHNIDLAPRIDLLQEGDIVSFYGEYEWNEKGGLIHWTHHDPSGDHVAGWLKHDGQLYQ